MNINTLIRYALAGLTDGAKILRYVFTTALLFVFFTIGASFGHLPIMPSSNVWAVLLIVIIIGGGAVLFWRGFSIGWLVNMAGLILVALTGLNPAFRLLGPAVGALYVLVSMLLIGGAASTGTIFGYGIAPGEATITNAPSGEVFGIVMLVTFWLVLTVLGVGIAAPFTEPLYIIGILGIALVVIPGSLYLGIGKTATRWVFGIASALLIILVAAAILDSLHTLKVIPQSPAKALWRGVTHDQCAVDRDATKSNLRQKLQDNEDWRSKNALWLNAGSALAKEYFARYESWQAMFKRQLMAADEKYELCKNAKSSSWSSVSGLGWVNAVIYEWPWWATMLLAPLVAICLFGAVFLGESPSDKAVDRALKFWVLWVALIVVLRII